MDLIIKYDNAFKWDEKDEQQAKEKRLNKRQDQKIMQVFNKAKKFVSKATS